MICPNCGGNLENDKLAFCVMCGCPLKDLSKQKGFFAKSGKSGISKAQELAGTAPPKPRTVPAAGNGKVQSRPVPASVQQPAAMPRQNTQEPAAVQSQPMAGMSNMAAGMRQMNGVQQPISGMPNMAGMQPMNGMQQPVAGTPNMAGIPPMNGMQQPMAGTPNMAGMQPMNGMQQPMAGVPNMTGMQPMNGMQQPMAGVPNMAGMQQMPGMPSMNGMPGMQGQSMPQQGTAENAAVPPQNPMMGGMPMMGMPGMMMGMPQYGMPQFMGYDQNGTPVYMQMVPQVVGYDAYGNPMYSMMPVQTYGMPNMPMAQMPGMPQPGMPQPGMSQAAMPQPGMSQAAMPQPGMAQAAVPQPGMVQAAVPQPGMTQAMPQAVSAPPAQNTVTVSDVHGSEMPVSAEALMQEDENAEPPETPDQETLLNQEAKILDSIFSDKPKAYRMSTGTQPSGQTFAINLSASEVISVGEDVPPTQKPTSAEPPKTRKQTASKSAPKPYVQPAPQVPAKKKPVSPEDFFDDLPGSSRRKMAGVKLSAALDNDADLEDQLAALEAEGRRKKSRRSMQAADKNLDAVSAVEDPTVSAAAQAILDDDQARLEAEQLNAQLQQGMPFPIPHNVGE